MEDLLRPIYQERASDKDTLGIIIIERTKPNSPITDNYDVILLIIVRGEEQKWHEKHYEFNDKTGAMHTVSEGLLTQWIDTSGYRKALEWLVYGKVIFDRNEYMTQLKEQLRGFPAEKRDLRKAMEFGKLVKSYSEAKDLYASEQYKDAYSRMTDTLRYLARLTVIDSGYHPEVTLWNQIKGIDPQVYKLYEELIESDEDIAKRVKLMILAADFVINNRAKTSANHLLTIMQTKSGTWTYEDLKQHPKTSAYQLDLTAMLSYLTEKEILITEREETKGKGVYQRKYRVN